LVPLSGDGFPKPEGIVQVEIDPSTGLLATEHCLQRQKEYFIKGTEPTIYCYGNNYERSTESSAPVSIYSSPSDETGWEIDGSEENPIPGNTYTPPFNEEEWEIDIPANNRIEEPEIPTE
jgi:hypothetical protein